jgi:lysophospholipase L1-like esterase
LLAAYNDSADGIHPGNTGHAAVAPVLVSLLANLIQP